MDCCWKFAGTIISSADDGLNWSVVSAGGTFQLNSVHYQNNVWLGVGGVNGSMNSIDGSTWYKKHVVSAGTPLGTQLNAVTYGDNKMVAVGIQSSLVWSGYEKLVQSCNCNSWCWWNNQCNNCN